MANDVGRLIRLNGKTLADLARATVELGIARLRLGARAPHITIQASPLSAQILVASQSALVDRVAFAIPRVASRLPWRADCLVQALAAERWLGRHGIATTLTLGVPRNRPATFEAHAWLKAGDRIVTGGEISGYEPLAHP